MFKRISIIILFALLILFFASFCLAQTAQDRPLEVTLPAIGADSEITTTPLLPNCIRYIFNLAVIICGFISFGVLVLGGVRYIVSAGNPSTMSDANSQMLSGIMGLVIILGSWLILNTINPELKKISVEYKPSELTDIGIAEVLLCKSAGDEEKDCKLVQRDASTLGDFDGKVGYVKFKEAKDLQYGAVLFSKADFQGNCVVCLGEGCNIAQADGGYSIKVFTMGSDGGTGGEDTVILYEADDYNKQCGPDCYQQCPSRDASCGSFCIGFDIFGWEPKIRGAKCWTFSADSSDTGIGITEKVRSLSMAKDYLVVAFDHGNFTGNCEVYRTSRPAIGAQTIKSIKVIPLK
ncbi:MAG TPA: pilin [Candidatus Paceibacterota bacterium]|nr:pilin [Candidatus Paceibacterota bacterium]